MISVDTGVPDKIQLHSRLDAGGKPPRSVDAPGGAAVKNPPANAGDVGSISGPEGPTCCRATRPVPTLSRARALQQEKPLP